MNNNQQGELDAHNAQFWNELCGTGLARSLGINNFSKDNLRRFDAAYMAFYPYLQDYIPSEAIKNKNVLEIGLGFGTFGQALRQRKCNYFGVDIAWGPVRMMRYRLSNLQEKSQLNIHFGSALDLPFKDSKFDYYYSIGCLHHTGNIKRAISEAYRVLKPGGKAIIMIYNKYSFRLLVLVPLLRIFSFISKRVKRRTVSERIRAFYDTNSNGKSAPHTDFTSLFLAKQLFKDFSYVHIDIRNFDQISFKGKVLLKREFFLNNIARFLGLDLYITASK